MKQAKPRPVPQPSKPAVAAAFAKQRAAGAPKGIMAAAVRRPGRK